MPKKQARRPQKRQAQKPEIDEDLRALAEVLDEHRFSQSTDSWFKLPWNDGWNAARLAFDVWVRLLEKMRDSLTTSEHDMRAAIAAMTIDRDPTREVYIAAEEILQCAVATRHINGRDDLIFVAAAMRCVMLTISNSSGGGATYNEILSRAFDSVYASPYSDLVRQHRCVDVTGVAPQLKGDINDRLRRAFSIAWDRGLYSAAYALPRAIRL